MFLGADGPESSLHDTEQPLQSEELEIHREGASCGTAGLQRALSHAGWLFHPEEGQLFSYVRD